MIVTLALTEIALFYIVVSSAFTWFHNAGLGEWRAVTTPFGPAFTPSLCCALSFYYSDLYKPRVISAFQESCRKIFQSMVLCFILVTTLYAAYPGTGLLASVLSGLMLVPVIGFVGVPVRWGMYRFLQHRAFRERVLLIGTGPLARKVAEAIQRAPNSRFAVAGFIEEKDEQPGAVPHGQILGGLGDLARVVERVKPHRIVVALREHRTRLPVFDLLQFRTAGLTIQLAAEAYESLTGKIAIECLGPADLVFSGGLGNVSNLQRSLRGAFSLAASVVGLLVSAPIMLLVPILIKLDSAGPVFFIQPRVGRAGRVFGLIKFRTMHPAPAGEPEPVWERDCDSRVTRLGSVLRKLRIDELPQFFNILRGDMDLVGPRPEMACNVMEMTRQIPFYGLRQLVRPGVTGWAQINNGYAVSQEEVTEKVRYDLYYIKHLSLWFDLRIILGTVRFVIFGRGVR